MTPTLLCDGRTRDQRLQDLLIALETAGLPPDRYAAARSLVFDSMRPTLTWRSPTPGRHLIDGLRVDSDLVGLMAAHLACMHPGEKTIRAADMAVPGAAQPANAVRNALRTAARFLGPLNPRAAAAVRLVRVVDGFVVYRPDGRFDVAASL